MKKLLTILTLAVLTTAAVAQTPAVPTPITGVSANVGFTSKLIDRGNVAGTDYVTARVGLDVYSVDFAIDTFSRYNSLTITTTVAGKSVSTADEAGLKRIYYTAGYVFTSPLANLTLGAQLRTAQNGELIAGGLTSDTLPFVKLSGDLFGKTVVWDGTALDDLKNRSNNYEFNLRLPVSSGVKGLKVVPAIGVGFNDPGAATIAAFKNNKKYATAGIGLAAYGFTANVFAHRADVTNTAGQVLSLIHI